MDRYRLDLIDHLSGFVTEQRLRLFLRVLDHRTRYLTVLLEDIFQSQNASAVLRTCDCMGIQDVHIVEERNPFRVNPDIALGSHKWLTVHYHQESESNIEKTIRLLREKGYRIVATVPHMEGATPEEFDLEKGKSALMFGTELTGLTDRALALADDFIQIPMVGFTESLNISVSLAVILYQLRIRLERSTLPWQISEEEKNEILLEWLRGSIRMSREIERKFKKKYDPTF